MFFYSLISTAANEDTMVEDQKREDGEVKKPRRKSVLPLDRRRFKGELFDDERPEKYELSEEFQMENPLKTPPNNLTTKNPEKKEKE